MEQDAKTVLYVEDEENDRFFMEVAFQKEGLQQVLRTVTDGQAAIAYFSGDGVYADRGQYPLPSLVLLDLNLPEAHGLEVLKWIRDRPDLRDLPVVIFSSAVREQDRARAQELGANDFWPKPASGFGFLNVVKRLREKWPEALSGPAPPVRETLLE